MILYQLKYITFSQFFFLNPVFTHYYDYAHAQFLPIPVVRSHQEVRIQATEILEPAVLDNLVNANNALMVQLYIGYRYI